MDTEIVKLGAKTLVGLGARTANNDPNMGQIIGGLWQKLFGEGIFSAIANKCNDRSIGLYSDYASDVSGAYDVTVGCEISSAEELPEGTIVKTIPAGNYAKFVVYGDDEQAVGKLWQEIWSLPLDRTYSGDFEEYYAVADSEPREIHIYVAVK